MVPLLLRAVGLLLTLDQVAALSCLDEQGRSVDWWILYKLPKQSTYKHPVAGPLGEGRAYAFLTSALPNQRWTLSSMPIDDPNSMPGQTLAPLYSNASSLFHLLYNDEEPHGKTSFTRGHTKGLVLATKDSGSLWLIHSIPHYPPFPNETYSYPRTGHRYGQTAMCVSTNSKSLDPIGTQLQFNNPFIYSANRPPWLSSYPAMLRASKGKHIRKPPFFSTVQLSSVAGIKFTSFAKYTRWGKDLYADLVAPSLRVPLAVETWPNGPGKMPSRCSTPFIVENVNEMDFSELDDDDFTTKHDHAKWAISLDSKQPYVCIGDINRMDTQKKRGGGTLCFLNPTVWKTFKNSIKVMEECPRGSQERDSEETTEILKDKVLKKLKKSIKKPGFWKSIARNYRLFSSSILH